MLARIRRMRGEGGCAALADSSASAAYERGRRRAGVGRGVEVTAAGKRIGPVGFDALVFRQHVRPGIARHVAIGLPPVELAVGLDFADQHRLGQVMVRQDLGRAAREVRHLEADDRLEDGVGIGGAAASTAFTHRLKPMVGRFHRVVGRALVVVGVGRATSR